MSLPAGLANKVYRRDGWKCRHCKLRQHLHPHHVQFQSHNGPDTIENLLTLCSACHAGVHACKLILWAVLGQYVVHMTGSNFEKIDERNVLFVRAEGWKPQ